MPYQQITLVGRVGADAEMRFTPAGVPVCSFSLAVSRTWKDTNGQRQEKVLWFRISAWRKLAETMAPFVLKGRELLVVGEIEEPRQFTDKQGNSRISLDVTADRIVLIGPRPTEDDAAPPNTGTPLTTPSSDEDIPF